MKTLGSFSASPNIQPNKLKERLSHKRPAVGLGATIIVIVVIMVAVVAVFEYFPPSSQSVIPLPGQGTASSSVNSGNVAGKIQFVITNPLSGAAATPTTFKVYPAAGSVIGGQTYGGLTASETITISGGTGTSALIYPPGTVLNVYELLSSSQTMYWKVIAPGVTSAQQGYGTAAQVAMPEPVLPTITIQVTDNKGNAYTGGTSIANFTAVGHCTTNNFCLGETSIGFTVNVIDTVANTGYISSYDPINSQNWCAALQVKESGTNVNLVSITGFPTTYGAFTVGTIRYWQGALPDGLDVKNGLSNIIQQNYFGNPTCAQYSTATGSLSTQLQGQTNVGGTATQTFTINEGSFGTHGNTATETLQVYTYYDLGYAAQNAGNGGVTAATLGSSFALKLGA